MQARDDAAGEALGEPPAREPAGVPRDAAAEAVPRVRLPAPPPASRGAWVLLALVLVFAGLTRARVVDAPLERDEGEYAYAGQLLLDGVWPYAEVYNMKLPGIYAAYAAVLAVVPDTAGGTHAALVVITAATCVLVFLIGRRIGAPGHGAGGGDGGAARADLVGVLAAAGYAVLTLGKHIQGLFANAEHFVVLPALAGVLLLLVALSRSRLGLLAASGLCFGAAFLVKQHGAAFGLFGLVWLVLELARGSAFAGRRAAALGSFAAAGLAPLALAMTLLALAGIFDAFWWWTFEYARDYVGQIPLRLAHRALANGGGPVVSSAPLVWGASALGLTALVWSPATRGARLFLALFALLSFLATCPGFFFRPHYFVLAVPAAALLAAVGLAGLGDGVARLARSGGARRGLVTAGVAGALAAVALGQSVAAQATYLFQLSPRDVTRHTFPMNPFAESREVARIIAAHTEPDDRIAVLGSEPQIGFYARRRLATGFIYMYPLMEQHAYAETLQRQLIEELERNDPKVIVWVPVNASWLGDPSQQPVLREFIGRLGERYVELGQIRVDPRGLGLVWAHETNFSLVLLKKQG